jgi:hypothetical protein
LPEFCWGELKDGIAVVSTRAVAAGFQGGWVNATLIGAALDIAWEHGVTRARFSYTETNHDTQKLAARFRAETVSVIARYVRHRVEGA